MKDKQIDWLEHIISQKRKAIHEWQQTAYRTNICDNMGISPIDKLSNEIKIAESLIEMCSTTQ